MAKLTESNKQGVVLSAKECEKYHRILIRLIEGIESDEVFHFDIEYAKDLLEKLQSGSSKV